MKRKHPRTVGGWAAKYRRDLAARDAAHAEAIDELRRELREAEATIEDYAADERWRNEAKQLDWTAYDRAAAAVSARERALFEASPAYLRYQQERAAAAELEPYTEAEKKRRLLQTGNWRAP